MKLTQRIRALMNQDIPARDFGARLDRLDAIKRLVLAEYEAADAPLTPADPSPDTNPGTPPV